MEHATIGEAPRSSREHGVPYAIHKDGISCLNDIGLKRALSFVTLCEDGHPRYRLTPRTDVSPYASCFALYVQYLLQKSCDVPADQIAANVRSHRKSMPIDTDGKAYKQLLAFSLSALSLFGTTLGDTLDDLVLEQTRGDVTRRLSIYRALEGAPQSGNHAMFLAIFLLHARDRLGVNVGSKVEEWVDRHLSSMNRFGFWGEAEYMTHLQFQNGYHQHEMLEFLGIASPREADTLRAVCQLADREGHFAPYPGGGGCYDYDAVFLLTPRGIAPEDVGIRALLAKCAQTITGEQNADGGFCESKRVRPRTIANLYRFSWHVVSAIGSGPLLFERLFHAINLQRPKHGRIRTHWSELHREWSESNLWDTWFRLLTLARIETAFNPSKAKDWGFIGYPGIGFHPSCHPGWEQSIDR